MPLYEYNCECGAQWEAVTYSYERPGSWERECHICGKLCEPKLSAPAIQFKGQRWSRDSYGLHGGGHGGSDSEE